MHKNVECWVLFLFDGRGEIGSIYLWKFKICNRARNSAWYEFMEDLGWIYYNDTISPLTLYFMFH